MSLFHPDESPEELHERVDKILEERTKVYPICIVCRNPVTETAELVPSRHGPYHYRCIDGHP